MSEENKEISLEYSLAQLTEQFKQQISDLKEKYSIEKSKLILTKLSTMASDLRERNGIVSDPKFEEAPSEIEEKLKESNLFITIYKNLNRERLDEETRKKVDAKYEKAIKEHEKYQYLLESMAKIDKEKEAGILIIKSGDDSYLYPTMCYEDIEKAPSLMLSLLEYCLTSCEKTRIPTGMPEKEGNYLRIKLSSQSKRDENSLLNILRSNIPDGFKKANLKFIVLREQDYSLEPRKISRHVEAVPKQITPRQVKGKKTFGIEDVAEELGITPTSAMGRTSRYFKRHRIEHKPKTEYKLTEKQFKEITSKKDTVLAKQYRNDVIELIKADKNDDQVKEEIKRKYGIENMSKIQGTINIYRYKLFTRQI